jgi:hypothetical protein
VECVTQTPLYEVNGRKGYIITDQGLNPLQAH